MNYNKNLISSSTSYFSSIRIYNHYNSSRTNSSHSNFNELSQKNFSNQTSFHSFIEKFNSKINMWFTLYMLIENNQIYFFEKKFNFNNNSNLKTLCKENFLLDNKITISFHKNFRKGSINKLNVISFRMNNQTLNKSNIEDDSYNIFISIKNDSLFFTCKSVLENILNCSNIINNSNNNLNSSRSRNNKNILNERKNKISLKKNNTLNKLITFDKINDENNSINNKNSKQNLFSLKHFQTNSINNNFSKFNQFRNNSNNLNNNNSKNNSLLTGTKKGRNRSCFGKENINTSNSLKSIIIKDIKKNNKKRSVKVSLEKNLILEDLNDDVNILDNNKHKFLTINNNNNKKTKKKIIIKKLDLKNININNNNNNKIKILKENNFLTTKKNNNNVDNDLEDNNFNESENNTTLISLLGKMISTNKLKRKKRIIINNNLNSPKQTNDFSINLDITKEIENPEIIEEENTAISINKNNNNDIKIKEQISKIIDVSIMNEETSFILPHNNKINNNYNDNNKKKLNTRQPSIYDINKIIDINNINENEISLININNDIDNNKEILNFINQIDSNKIFIYDSFILKSIIKTLNLKSKDLGKIFLMSTNMNIKSFILCNMISIISKKFLSLSIIKSLEIIFREKEININYIIKNNNPHSIEYNICDVFNTFLSCNNNNYNKNILYNNVLPVYLKEIFNIDLTENEYFSYINEKINKHTLFVCMQFYNRIFFNENLNIDFNLMNPFEYKNIKYISPYVLKKWEIKAKNNISCNFNISNCNFINNNDNRNISNKIKRIRTKLEEEKVPNDIEILKILKQYDISLNKKRINTINSIYKEIINKKYENGLKLCDYYIQSFNDTLFNNSLIYINLSFIYNEINGIEYAKMFFKKSIDIFNWLFPYENCYIIFEIYYKYILILMKQKEEFIRNNFDEIIEIFEKCENYSKKFFENKVIYKLKIQKIIFDLSYRIGNNNDNNNNISINEDIMNEYYKEVINCINDMRLFNNNNDNDININKNYWKEEMNILNLFIDLFKKYSKYSNNFISNLIQKMYIAKKNYELALN